MNKISYNDMHNIFKCNNYINNIRSNYKFANYNDIKYNSYDLNKVKDSDNYISTSAKIFCPENESKGLISRAIMYMSYEYNLNYKKVIDYDNLINWCLKYPPSEYELIHNQMVYMKQYKKNKFINLYYRKNYINYISKLFY